MGSIDLIFAFLHYVSLDTSTLALKHSLLTLQPNQFLNCEQYIMHQQFLPFAEKLADTSGDIIRKYFRTSYQSDTKLDTSPVTIADKETEAALRAMIASHYPDHAIIGEEYGITRKESPYCWVIDPIDGTKSFIIGRAIFGTLISLNYNAIPVIGIIDQPISQERWMGLQGHGATLNGQPISTRNCSVLSEAILCTTARELFNSEDGAAFDKVSRASKYTVYGGDCYNYGLLAMGTVDIVVEAGLQPYDFCALATITNEAGGVCTDWEGNSINYYSDGRIVASGNKYIHEKVLELLA